MPNKTIYVKDEELWNKAKAIAGKEGLSGVIAEALASFVTKHEDAAEGQQEHHFTIEYDREMERVAFVGRKLDERAFVCVDAPHDMTATVYETKSGKFVLILGEVGVETPYHYAVYSWPEGIAENVLLRQLADEDEIQKWARALKLRHFEKTEPETWIQ